MTQKLPKDLEAVCEAVCNEKRIDREAVLHAVEDALATVVRRKLGMNLDVCVRIDRDSGTYTATRRWQVVDDEDPEFRSPDWQVLLSYAQVERPDIEVGEWIEEPLEYEVSFARISAHTAKQVVIQKVREAERQRISEAYRDKVGTLIMGTVKRDEHSGTYVDHGENAEGMIRREDKIFRDSMRPGDRVRAYLSAVSDEGRGPQLLLSRTAPELLIELFKLEVPEINQGLIEIMGAARDPGLRAKIAVRSNDVRLDPVGACVGMRGSRVQSVSNELAGERIDIITWDETPAQYVINAMSPATVSSIFVDEENRSMDIAVEEEKLSQAIGRGGQNVKLASRLTGWELNVMTVEEAEQKQATESSALQAMFQEKLGVDEEVAFILAHEGFTSIEDVADAALEDLKNIEEFDDTLADELHNRAQSVLLEMEMAEDKHPAEDLLAMENMTRELAYQLVNLGVRTMNDLAECAVDELRDIEGLDEERAGAFIMAARAPWFEKEAQDGD